MATFQVFWNSPFCMLLGGGRTIKEKAKIRLNQKARLAKSVSMSAHISSTLGFLAARIASFHPKTFVALGSTAHTISQECILCQKQEFSGDFLLIFAKFCNDILSFLKCFLINFQHNSSIFQFYFREYFEASRKYSNSFSVSFSVFRFVA